MKKLSMLLLAASAFAMSGCCSQCGQDESGAEPVVYAINNLSHYYDFHADWGFKRQYLNGGEDKYTTGWSCIYNTDLSNANMLMLFNCDDRLPYIEQDIKKIKSFLKEGGSLMILSNGTSTSQNDLAQVFGASFAEGVAAPLTAAEKYATAPEVAMKGSTRHHLVLDKPAKWTVAVTDAEGNPMLAYTKKGKGKVLVGVRGLLGDNTDDIYDTINREMWHRVWRDVVRGGKTVDPEQGLKHQYIECVENKIQQDGLDITYNDYLAPCAEAMFQIAKKTMPVVEGIMGVPLSANMGSKIVLIPTGGGGYSAGEVIALAVWWGDFPNREDSMIEFITHESVHSWVLPWAEIWNEPIATYVGYLAMMELGHKEEAERRIANTIRQATKLDPEFNLYDVDGKSWKRGVEDVSRDQLYGVHWGKSMWIFEQLRAENPDWVADYYKAKRAMANPDQISKLDANNTVALVSVAMGRDMFPWFRSIGFDVKRANAEIKF